MYYENLFKRGSGMMAASICPARSSFGRTSLQLFHVLLTSRLPPYVWNVVSIRFYCLATPINKTWYLTVGGTKVTSRRTKVTLESYHFCIVTVWRTSVYWHFCGYLSWVFYVKLLFRNAYELITGLVWIRL